MVKKNVLKLIAVIKQLKYWSKSLLIKENIKMEDKILYLNCLQKLQKIGSFKV